MVENRWGVAKRQWKRWTPHAQRVFNYLYELMNENPDLFLHPKLHGELDPKFWKTTSWNAAWIAAEGVDRA